jgi:hypothetical protein
MLAQGWTWHEWVTLPLADPGGFGVLFLIGLGFLIWAISAVRDRKKELGKK